MKYIMTIIAAIDRSRIWKPVNSSPLMQHICVRNWTSIGSGNGFLTIRRHALPEPTLTNNNWTLRKNLQWNSNQNTNTCIRENAFENAVCDMAAILFWMRWVKRNWLGTFVLAPNFKTLMSAITYVWEFVRQNQYNLILLDKLTPIYCS